MRQQYIDILKGITIIWVLWMYMNLPELLYPSVQMPIFFFLSGTFYRAKDSFVEQFKNDFYRLLIPTICFMVISGCLMTMRGDNIWSWNIISVLQKLRNGSITYFLIALFVYRAVNYPFEWRKRKYWFLALFILLYPIGFLWKVYLPQFEFPIIPVQEIMMFGIYYAIGYVFGKKVIDRNSILSFYGKGSLLCCMSYVIFVHIVDWEKGVFSHIPWVVYGFVYTCSCIYIGLVVCQKIEKIDLLSYLSHPLAYIGKNSIVFYLTHWPIWMFLFKPLGWNLYMVFAFIVLIEFPLTYILTNYLSWMIGKK